MKKLILILLAILGLLSQKAFAQPANDNCATATSLGTLPVPAACPSGVGTAVTQAGTLVGATPASPYIYQNGCSGAGGPNMGVPANDVWYSFVASGYEAVITVNGTFANPNIAMYAGSCASLGGGVGGCAVGTGGTATLTVQQMVIGTTYYIQVSGNVGQTGTFNISVKNNKSCSDCITSTNLTVSPPPVNGMYNPGQTVHFCYHIDSYAEINTNWLHGVQISFGAGWNSASLVPSAVTSYSCGTWLYYPAGIGIVNGINWGPGFYFDRTCAPLGGGTAGDGNPANNFGDHITPNSTLNQNIWTIPPATWNFCFDLTVAAGCSPGSNLSVIINTSGDGESGPWTSAGCATDPATPFNAIGACCQPTMTSVAATCVGNDGTATATPVGGAGPFDYVWTNAGGTIISTTTGVAGANTITGLGAGVYTVAITNSLNCLITNTVTVGSAGAITTPTAGSNSPVCAGGTLNLTAVTVAGAIYSWTGPNSFTSLIQNPSIIGVTTLASGVYTVTASMGGCTSTSTVNVTINPVPTVNVPASFTVCNGAAVPITNFTSVPAGGTFTWTNSNTAIGVGASGVGNVPAFTASNLTAAAISGTIIVTPTLAGCPGTPSSYTITVNPTPTVTVPANITVCNGGNIPATAFISTPGGGTFAWTNSNPAIGIAAAGVGNIATFNGTNLTTAPITATITVTPTVAGCPGTPNTYTITVNPTPTVTAPANIIVCNGANIPATNFTSPTAGASFTWTNSNTLIGLGASGIGNISAFNATNVSGSPITAVITVTPTANGCVGSPSTYNITVNSSLLVNAGLDDTICFGANTTLNATPNGVGYIYSWSPATGLSNTTIFNPVATPSATTIYTVTITNPSGCVGSDNLTIYSDPQITIAKTEFDVTCNGLCNGQTIVIPAGGTPGYTYSWTGGCTTAACAGLCPGSYTVTVTDSWGCTATDDTIVAQPPVLVASITGTTPTSCNGVCDGTATGSAIGGFGAYNYSWNTIPVQNTTIATALCAGGYILTVTDGNSCIDTVHATIIQPTPVTNAAIASVIICIGGNTTLTAVAGGGSGGYVYTWDAPGTFGFANTSSVNVSPLLTTTYTVHVVDANGCVGPDVTVTVTVNPPLTVVAAGTISICPGASANISALANGGSGGPYTYTWGPAGTGVGSAITVSPAVTTTYTVVATDGCGSPPAIDSVTITVLPVPTVLFIVNINSGCEPLCVNFTDGSNIAVGTLSTWNWNFGDATPNSTFQNPAHCYNNPGVYSVTLTVVSNSSCTSTFTINNMITVYPLPTAQYTASPNPTDILEPLVAFTDQSLAPPPATINYWFWDFGDGNTLAPSTQNPTHTYPNAASGIYPTILIVENNYGCRDTIIHDIIINPEFTFFIPNAFSPNGDGINDEFFGSGVGIAKYELIIFDRWGNLIFYTDKLNDKWNGHANHGSEIAQQDVYVWKVKLTDVFDKKHNYIGTVTIVK